MFANDSRGTQVSHAVPGVCGSSNFPRDGSPTTILRCRVRTAPEQLQQVVNQTHQLPFPLHLFKTSQEEIAKSQEITKGDIVLIWKSRMSQ